MKILNREAYGEIRRVEYIKTAEWSGTKMDICRVERSEGQIAYFGYSTEAPFNIWIIGLDVGSVEDCLKTFVKNRWQEKRFKEEEINSVINLSNKNLLLWRKQRKSM